ncbi:MAG: hypothetical protein ACR2OC_12645 [Solirubrobacterales bacterium]
MDATAVSPTFIDWLAESEPHDFSFELAYGDLVGSIEADDPDEATLVARQQTKKAEHDRWLFENGLRGTATLVEASSNTRINDQPVLKMVLDVEVPGQARRRVQQKILMSNFVAYRMRPGVVLPVHANPDPQKPGDMLVRW